MSLPDPIDQASHHDLMDTASAINVIRDAAKRFEPGQIGLCKECDNGIETRIVRGMCCKCRDKVNR